MDMNFDRNIYLNSTDRGLERTFTTIGFFVYFFIEYK